MSKLASIVFVSTLGLLSISAVVAGQAARPNIVFILADDLGWADVSFHGAKDIKTPNIDRLAESGARLESFYAMPMCTPSRAAFLTGRYPMRYGLQSFVITPGQHYGLPTDERTVAQALKVAGYKTYAVGKWHLGHSKKAFWPQNRGFDYFYGSTIGNVDYYTKERGGVVDWQRNGEAVQEDGYFTEVITQDAVRIIEQQSDEHPFFLYLPHLAPHSPYQAPQKYIDRYKHIKDEHRRVYAAMITALDDSVARVLNALERKGLRENTLVVFVSDNGGLAGGGYGDSLSQVAGDKPAPADNGPFRGAKATLYEGGVRSVAIANWPGHVKPCIVRELIHMVDWLPTLAGLAGCKSETDKPLDGKDVWPVITKGEPSPHSDILINVEFHRGAVRKGKWKLVKHAALPSRVELFDLSTDPGEKKDLAKQCPEQVAQLEALLNDYARQSTAALYFREYLPFVVHDAKNATMVYDGDEDSGQPGEKPVLPK